MTALELIAVSLAGGLISLDRTSAFQLMISRPIVAAPIVGFMLGDPATGLKAGLLLELLWIGYLPVGASVPPDETLVSIAATGVSVWLIRSFESEYSGISTVVFSLIFLIPAAIVVKRIDFRIRKLNVGAARLADIASEKLDLKALERACLSGLWRSYATYVVVLILLLSGGFLAASIFYPILPEQIYRGLGYASLLIPVLGLASLFSAMRLKGRYLITGLSCGFCLVIMQFLGPI